MTEAELDEVATAERGQSSRFFAIMLIVLMRAAAMAVDLGWLCITSIEVQHGAASAALAGVIYEPDLRARPRIPNIYTGFRASYQARWVQDLPANRR